MDRVGRFARLETRALSQLANKLVVTFLGFAKIFSRFLHLHAAVGQRRFLAREQEQSSPTKVTTQIVRDVFRELASRGIVTFDCGLDQVLGAVVPFLPNCRYAAGLVFAGVTNRACQLVFDLTITRS